MPQQGTATKSIKEHTLHQNELGQDCMKKTGDYHYLLDKFELIEVVEIETIVVFYLLLTKYEHEVESSFTWKYDLSLTSILPGNIERPRLFSSAIDQPPYRSRVDGNGQREGMRGRSGQTLIIKRAGVMVNTRREMDSDQSIGLQACSARPTDSRRSFYYKGRKTKTKTITAKVDIQRIERNGRNEFEREYRLGSFQPQLIP
uniref:Uncharacterized protein n=1 Tax=Heterorhabditis bacteriophora TaxID=37862 RepID=A0A1I7XU87_HETBA